MEYLESLEEAVNQMLPAKAREALVSLMLPTFQLGAMGEYLARLRHQVPPAYLPFATFEGSPLALHLVPGIEVSRSPVVYIASGSMAPKFVCGQFDDLPRGSWLWVARYFKNRVDTLRAATAELADARDGFRSVPDALWTILDEAPEYQPTWWSHPANEFTLRAWSVADVGHPFVRLRKIDRTDAGSALRELRELVTSEPHPAPELVAAMIAAQVSAGEEVSFEDLLYVLSAEAWLGGQKIIKGVWSPTEQGLSEWSMVLKIALKLPGCLDASPFAGLAGHPETYSGRDPLGRELMTGVARRFSEKGDYGSELRQLRNAAYISLFSNGWYEGNVCDDIADACDRVTARSLAATLARAYSSVGPTDA